MELEGGGGGGGVEKGGGGGHFLLFFFFLFSLFSSRGRRRIWDGRWLFGLVWECERGVRYILVSYM